MNEKKFLKWLTRNLLVVGFVSLFTDLSSQMVFPLIPLYLTTILGAGAWVVGLVEGAAEATASLLKVFSGYWSDRIKQRKPFVLAGYGLSSIIKPLFAFTYTWPLVLLARISERVGKGIRNAPRDAIIAETTDISVRGKAYGFHRAMDGIGSISGAILALVLLPLLGFRNIFLIAFIPGIIAVFIILLIKEKNKPDNIKKEKKISFKVSLKGMPSNLKLFTLASTIFAFGHFGYAFLLLKANNIGLTNGTTISLYALFYITYTLCVIPTGVLSDKIGRKPVLMTGYILFGAIDIGLLFTSQIYEILIIFVIYGIFYAMLDGVQRAFVADLAPANLKATALGAFHTSIGIIALPGGFLAGILWDVISPEVTFLFSLALTLISITLFIFVKNTK